MRIRLNISARWCALAAPRQTEPASQPAPADQRGAGSRWWSLEEGRQHVADQRAPARTEASGADDNDDFPRIVRTRLRG